MAVGLQFVSVDDDMIYLAMDQPTGYAKPVGVEVVVDSGELTRIRLRLPLGAAYSLASALNDVALQVERAQHGTR